jgi:integrase
MMRKRGNGSIFQQQGCSTYTIQYYAYNGKRVRESTGADDYRAAQQMLRERLTAIGRDEPIEPRRRRQVLMSELYDGLTRDYRVNGRRSLNAVESRWVQHLKEVFANMPARNVTHDVLNNYLDKRLGEKAANATVNRELAVLKTMLRLGSRKHKLTLPIFPHLDESKNVRRGFIEQDGFDRLRSLATELWQRLFLEMAFQYGWRKQELLGLRVRQVNVLTGLIRLDVGTTKNGEGREVTMTRTIRELVRQAVAGKNPDDHLLTRGDGAPVRDFRKGWKKLCQNAGLDGLHIHDFRRSAARELRKAGVPESTIMDIGGWKTREMFKRYAITDSKDIAAAIAKRELAQAENSHDFSHDSTSHAPVKAESTAGVIN